jgi:hypothetical protein
LEEGHLLGRQDLLRGVRWHGTDDDDTRTNPTTTRSTSYGDRQSAGS